jgi:hypothetical protein
MVYRVSQHPSGDCAEQSVASMDVGDNLRCEARVNVGCVVAKLADMANGDKDHSAQ